MEQVEKLTRVHQQCQKHMQHHKHLSSIRNYSYSTLTLDGTIWLTNISVASLCSPATKELLLLNQTDTMGKANQHVLIFFTQGQIVIHSPSVQTKQYLGLRASMDRYRQTTCTWNGADERNSSSMAYSTGRTLHSDRQTAREMAQVHSLDTMAFQKREEE